jgi:hypothetical protein
MALNNGHLALPRIPTRFEESDPMNIPVALIGGVLRCEYLSVPASIDSSLCSASLC